MLDVVAYYRMLLSNMTMTSDKILKEVEGVGTKRVEESGEEKIILVFCVRETVDISVLLTLT